MTEWTRRLPSGYPTATPVAIYSNVDEALDSAAKGLSERLGFEWFSRESGPELAERFRGPFVDVIWCPVDQSCDRYAYRLPRTQYTRWSIKRVPAILCATGSLHEVVYVVRAWPDPTQTEHF